MINHTITVRNRRIKVDIPRLIQGCDGSDAIILDLDDEWTGLDEILVSIGSGDSRQDAIWDGEPMVIEHVDFPIGYLPVSVTGRITENQNTNYRQLHDELVAYRMEDKDNTIAELRSQVNALNLSASQSNQNAYLVAQLKTPAPVPAYTVPNPNGYYGCQQNCYQSCGC